MVVAMPRKVQLLSFTAIGDAYGLCFEYAPREIIRTGSVMVTVPASKFPNHLGEVNERSIDHGPSRRGFSLGRGICPLRNNLLHSGDGRARLNLDRAVLMLLESLDHPLNQLRGRPKGDLCDPAGQLRH
jgi:hypothetical protein